MANSRKGNAKKSSASKEKQDDKKKKHSANGKHSKEKSLPVAEETKQEPAKKKKIKLPKGIAKKNSLASKVAIKKDGAEKPLPEAKTGLPGTTPVLPSSVAGMDIGAMLKLVSKTNLLEKAAGKNPNYLNGVLSAFAIMAMGGKTAEKALASIASKKLREEKGSEKKDTEEQSLLARLPLNSASTPKEKKRSVAVHPEAPKEMDKSADSSAAAQSAPQDQSDQSLQFDDNDEDSQTYSQDQDLEDPASPNSDDQTEEDKADSSDKHEKARFVPVSSDDESSPAISPIKSPNAEAQPATEIALNVVDEDGSMLPASGQGDQGSPESLSMPDGSDPAKPVVVAVESLPNEPSAAVPVVSEPVSLGSSASLSASDSADQPVLNTIFTLFPREELEEFRNPILLSVEAGAFADDLDDSSPDFSRADKLTEELPDDIFLSPTSAKKTAEKTQTSPKVIQRSSQASPLGSPKPSLDKNEKLSATAGVNGDAEPPTKKQKSSSPQPVSAAPEVVKKEVKTDASASSSGVSPPAVSPLAIVEHSKPASDAGSLLSPAVVSAALLEIDLATLIAQGYGMPMPFPPFNGMNPGRFTMPSPFFHPGFPGFPLGVPNMLNLGVCPMVMPPVPVPNSASLTPAPQAASATISADKQAEEAAFILASFLELKATSSEEKSQELEGKESAAKKPRKSSNRTLQAKTNPYKKQFIKDKELTTPVSVSSSGESEKTTCVSQRTRRMTKRMLESSALDAPLAVINSQAQISPVPVPAPSESLPTDFPALVSFDFTKIAAKMAQAFNERINGEPAVSSISASAVPATFAGLTHQSGTNSRKRSRSLIQATNASRVSSEAGSSSNAAAVVAPAPGPVSQFSGAFFGNSASQPSALQAISATASVNPVPSQLGKRKR